MRLPKLMFVPCAAVLLCASMMAQAGGGPPVTQTQYNYATIDFPGAGFTQAVGINNHGEIVGLYRLPRSRQYHGFLSSGDGAYTSIDVTGSLGTGAIGINDRGLIVGFFIDSHGVRHGYVYDEVAFNTIDVEGALLTEADAINESGTIVGFYIAGSKLHGFSLTKGKFKTIDVDGAFDTMPFGINARGDIVGNWDTDPSTTGHGFVLSRGEFIKFDDPNAAPDSTAGQAINAHEQVVGGYTDNNGMAHGFVATGATFGDIDFPGAVATVATGINAAGQIVGYYASGTGFHGFVATPHKAAP